MPQTSASAAARVVIADDHMLVRDGLKMLLSAGLGLDVVGETGDGAAVEAMVAELKPDLLVLDLELPHYPGLEVAMRLKTQSWAPKILILTGKLTAQAASRSLAAGADGYVVKHEDSAELLAAVQAVLAGRQYVCKAIAEQFQNDARNAAPVTSREREIINLIAAGRSNPDIADALHISVHTVRTHRQTLMAKLGLRNAAEITAYAIKHGL